MAERDVQKHLTGGGRSSEEVESPPESLEVSKDLSSEPNGSSSEKKRKRNTLNFDFDSPPKKVTWTLNSSSEAPGSWTPFINGEKVPEHIRQEWDAAFTQNVHGEEASSDSSSEGSEGSEEDDVNDVEVTLEAEANLEDDINDVGVKLEAGAEAGAVEHEDVGENEVVGENEDVH